MAVRQCVWCIRLYVIIGSVRCCALWRAWVQQGWMRVTRRVLKALGSIPPLQASLPRLPVLCTPRGLVIISLSRAAFPSVLVCVSLSPVGMHCFCCAVLLCDVLVHLIISVEQQCGLAWGKV